MSFADIVNEDQRLSILQALEQDPDYSQNEHTLGRMLQAVGHGISGDKLHNHLAWLREQGLIELQQVSGMYVAKLTRRGEDVALGRARVPGVARPRPGQ
ncbi:MAG: winged helix-turn-helix domain-containing protein [Chromatiales bacterium]|nr:winged helix-turn-helix domain-containing protein [Chromatiales bacterium]